jgi:hypothetical protein
VSSLEKKYPTSRAGDLDAGVHKTFLKALHMYLFHWFQSAEALQI